MASIDSYVSTNHQRATRLAPRLLGPPVAALSYPFLLSAFHASVVERGLSFAILSFVLLAMATAAPAVAIYLYWKLASKESPIAVEVRAKQLALLCVAAPPLYTALGVLLAMAHQSVSDLIVWCALWALVTSLALSFRIGRAARLQPVRDEVILPRLRIAHGISAAAIILIFLALHLTNHLSSLWSEATYRALMNQFEHIYRTKIVEPALVVALLFQIGSGVALLWQYTRRSTDFFRTLQICSGAYLLFFLIAHMNSVFIYARTIAGIPTDWNFATGAPTGLLRDAWNIRLLPHYLLAVFFVLTHLVLGARGVALAHKVGAPAANRFAIVGISLAGVLACAIILGLVGIHVR